MIFKAIIFGSLRTFLLLGLVAGGLLLVRAKPLEVETNEVHPVTTYNPFSTSFKWTKYNIAAVTTAGLVVAAGLTLLTALFFPMFIYKLCYALGGCQNTMDHYVDKFIGASGRRRRRSLSEMSKIEYALDLLKMAMQEYGSEDSERPIRQSVMKIPPKPQQVDDHQIGKRSPIDYIEPIMVMMSKAYNEYVDPELKKNFKKPPSTR